MSQQGGRPTGPMGPRGPEDDWWGQLYDDSTGDTGPTAAPDSLDDRFASASGTVGGRSGPGTANPTAVPSSAPTSPEPGTPWWEPSGPPGVPGPRSAGPGDAPGQRPAVPREPTPATPTGPADFPSGARRQGVAPSQDEPPATISPGPERPSVPPGPGRPTTPPGPEWSGTAPPDPGRPGPTPPAAAPQASGAAEPPPPPQPPPQPRAPGGRGRGGVPRGLTTSGSGPADLSEPPAAVPPPRSASGLPPLPPPFLPSLSEPWSEDAPDGTDRGYVGARPPTYDAEPTALPPAEPDGLDGLVPDTVLEGARYGTCTLRAVSVRGDSARYRGEPRRDALLVARFGAGEQALVLVAMATGARATAGAHRAAAEACRWIGRAVGRSHTRLVEDLRDARRGDLKSGLHRLTDRSLGRLRAGAAEQGLAPHEYAATLRCLLLPADPECRTRVFFGVGAGGLLRLRDGAWQDMEPAVGEVTGEPVLGFGSAPRGAFGSTPEDVPSETPEGDRLTMDLGITAAPGPHQGPPAEPPREPFRFRASVARPGDVLLMSTAGLAEPLHGEPGLGELLARRWAGRPAPGLGEFLADSGVRVKGYADDRTAAAVWEA
ncbi:protein phosphatase 2C domain-containing protein [Streptomyces sp. NPDC005930]|uniref:protein phosphatase 2C domain-containing protein n=1 Tax=Streptomyces sp. NPDC005930 TaxID=3364736 RepID=UPI00368CE979